jgi:glycosyltransferase involved in cell wall biosynthesis
MRILLAGDYPDDRRGGTSLVQHFLGLALRGLGHDVDLVYREDIPGSQHGGLRRMTTPGRLSALIRRRMAERGRYGAIVIHEPRASAYVRARARDRALPPCVAFSHVPERWLWDLEKRMAAAGTGRLSWKSRLLWPLTELTHADFALRHADRVWTLSTEHVEYLVNGLGVPRKRIARMDNGAPEAYFGVKPEPNPRSVLFVGSWIERKGRSALAKAFGRVAARVPGASLTVMGGGAPEADVLAAFDQACRGRVTVTPPHGDEEMMRALAVHGIFILPSLAEGMPLSLLEAMAAGLAPVTTATCGMKAVIRDGENGLLLPVNDALAAEEALMRLIGDEALRARLGAAARRTAEGLTWAKVAARAAEDLERLAAAHGNAADHGSGTAVPS